MAASQRQLHIYIYIYIYIYMLEILNFTYFTFPTVMSCYRGTNFYGFLLGKGIRKKSKHTELALNFIQKQLFNPKIPFSFHYS